MKLKSKDRHLDTPSEANRDKHINFIALENDEADPSDLPAAGKFGGAHNKNDKKNEKEPGKKRGKLPGTSFLVPTAMTLVFCCFVYFLILKAVALLLAMA